MQAVFIAVGEDIIARNILETDFWPELMRARPDDHFVLLVQPDRLSYFTERFAETRVSVLPYKRASAGRLERVVMSLARSGIHSRTNLWSKMRSYYRGDSGLLVTWLKRLEAATLGRSSLFKRVLRFAILALPEDRCAAALFTEHAPKALIALSLANFDFDVPLARSARRHKVPLIGMVRSWDNLSSHGLLRVVPDVLLLQNRFLKDMAIEYQALSEARTPMPIVGLPHYDVYARTDLLEDRAAFLRAQGLDPAKRIIYWVAMGEFLFLRDADVGPILRALIDEGKIKEECQILFSAHPKFLSTAEAVRKSNVVDALVDLPYLDSSGGSHAATAKLMNYIAHADVLVMGASTMAIDAAMLDKPVVCIGFDGKATLPYWTSVARFYDTYTHFEALLEAKGVRVARSPEALAEELNAYLADPARDRAGRARIREIFAEPFDGQAGKRLAEAIGKTLPV